MAVYFGRGPDRVGPVRSTRHYFVYLAAGFGAALVHIGASPQGYRALSQTGLVDVDEVEGAAGFSRDPQRAAPHNAYVSIPAIRRTLAGQGVDLAGTTGGLGYGAQPPPAGGKPSIELEIDYPGGERYVVQYRYEPSSRTYLRSMDGAPHRDAESGGQYAARAVIVELVAALPIPGDDAGRLDVEVVGDGDGFLALEGKVYPITWSKADLAAPTRYTYANGDPVLLPRGPVWVQVTPNEAGVVAR
jgi:hypothetical protein